MSRRRTSTKNPVSKEIIKKEEEEEEEDAMIEQGGGGGEEEGEGEVMPKRKGRLATRNIKTKLETFSFTSLAPTTTTTTTTTTNRSKKRKRSSSPTLPMNPKVDPDADADADADTKVQVSPQRKTKKMYKMELDEPPLPPPAHWKVTYHAIEEMRKGRPAPVDTMGCHAPMKETRIDVQARRFMTLVSLMLSSQTKDEVTHAAVQNLRAALRPRPEDDTDPDKEYLTVPNLLSTPIETIEGCINKVGFWRRKAQYLKSTADILHREYADEIPKSIEGLCALPGVGMKMAMLTMQNAWEENVGIGVDVHVHRITNRLGWYGKKGGKLVETKTPEETRVKLESWLPREYHRPINPLLVGFGQTVCTPLRPKCEECLLSKREVEIEWEEEGGKTKKEKVTDGPLCPSAFKGLQTGGSGTRKKKKMVVRKEEEVIEALVKIELEE